MGIGLAGDRGDVGGHGWELIGMIRKVVESVGTRQREHLLAAFPNRHQ
jgi:hypothetical protein